MAQAKNILTTLLRFALVVMLLSAGFLSHVSGQTQIATGNGEMMFFLLPDAVPANLRVETKYNPNLPVVSASRAGSGKIDKVASTLKEPEALCEGCYGAFVPMKAIVVKGVPEMSTENINGAVQDGSFIIYRLATGEVPHPSEERVDYPKGAITFLAPDLSAQPRWVSVGGDAPNNATGGNYAHYGATMQTSSSGQYRQIQQRSTPKRKLLFYPAVGLNKIPVVQAGAYTGGAPSTLPVGFLGVHAIGMKVNGGGFDFPKAGFGTTLVVRPMTREELFSPNLQQQLRDQNFVLKPGGIPCSLAIHSVGRGY